MTLTNRNDRIMIERSFSKQFLINGGLGQRGTLSIDSSTIRGLIKELREFSNRARCILSIELNFSCVLVSLTVTYASVCIWQKNEQDVLQCNWRFWMWSHVSSESFPNFFLSKMNLNAAVYSRFEMLKEILCQNHELRIFHMLSNHGAASHTHQCTTDCSHFSCRGLRGLPYCVAS